MVSVAGVILAAGRSERLGRPKQLLDVGGEPLLQIVVRNAVISRLEPVVLVLGHEAARIAAAVGDMGQQTVTNPDFAAGQSTSVRVGLQHVPPAGDAVLFLLGDQPEVTVGFMDGVIGAYGATGAPIVQAAYGGRPANPVLFDRKLFSELGEVTGDQGARSIVKRHAREVVRVPVSDDPPPADIDTEDDYRALLERWSGAPVVAE